jgi:protein-L-isoaspartate(D-aspartate) O-methyltransferase
MATKSIVLISFAAGVVLLWALLGQQTDGFIKARASLIDELSRQGITSKPVLRAMERVERHLFVPPNLQALAYGNHPLPIGEGQTISQPYVVAHMTELLGLKDSHRILEVGTGSGYQAAVLALLADSVFTVEIKSKLAEQGKERLKTLGYANIRCKSADGYYGWSEHAPFDGILITCAVNHVPPALLEQLKVGGHMVLPLGSIRYYQTLVRITKKPDDVQVEYLGSVAFVPMTGAAQGD